ncbi:unnamed protein product [Schistocephalus solidus]|uniref:Protein sleepless n=1 Tax=Schistocephalus solidus TaxID=70667 RepID=A0A0X3PMB9_SCHSO|nr:unnamed protein product [Schistocephalus solidus]
MSLKSSFIVVLIASLLVLFFSFSANAISCYQCNSVSDLGCYPLDKRRVPARPCPPTANSCFFLRQESDFLDMEGNSKEVSVRYLRNCSTAMPKEVYSCITRAGTGGTNKNQYCSCTTDACNKATSQLHASFLSFLVLPLCVLFLR